MASIEEVWGAPFPKRQPMNTRNGLVPEPKRDAQKEGRVYNSPAERTQATVQKHRKTIDDLTQSLPIAASEDDMERNFKPVQSRVREHMTVSAPPEYPYAPPSFQDNGQEMKLNRILHMIEQNRTGYETSSTHDMLLYIFTGVFFIYTFDTFVTLGKTMR
jgi:hypothetical protein